MYSSGATYLGWGVEAISGEGRYGYKSTFDNFNGKRSALLVGGGSGLEYLTTASAQQTPVGSDVTDMETLFLVDSYGRVQMPKQPAFFVSPNSNFNSNQDGITVTNWSTGRNSCFDRGNNFNTSTGTFTAPVAGVYHISISLLFDSGPTGTSWCGGFLYVNNAMRWDALGSALDSAYDYQRVAMSGPIVLQAGDAVTVRIRDQNGDGHIYDGDPYSWFSGHLIG
jgi:hypothetical protein